MTLMRFLFSIALVLAAVGCSEVVGVEAPNREVVFIVSEQDASMVYDTMEIHLVVGTVFGDGDDEILYVRRAELEADRLIRRRYPNESQVCSLSMAHKGGAIVASDWCCAERWPNIQSQPRMCVLSVR